MHVTFEGWRVLERLLFVEGRSGDTIAVEASGALGANSVEPTGLYAEIKRSVGGRRTWGEIGEYLFIAM
jgi:hypothetical protein